MPDNVPQNRLALARWFASTENPLTARVAVNRIWEQLFGTGLVETVEDLGSSGTLPSHPKLLDHLACRFQSELGWSVKSLLREVVLSATYSQASAVDKDVWQRDLRNRLLARGPRNRLSAEMVRDQALVVAGLLSEKMYGPPVMPPQPDGIWKSVYSGAKWKTSKGEDRFRRAVYTFWKRTSAYPSMLTFDAPAREVCSTRRISTNTPLQSLTTLNDPVFVECAESLAKRMQTEGNGSIQGKIAYGYELSTGQVVAAEDLAELVDLYHAADAEYRDQGNLNQTENLRSHHALTAVASALLNIDRSLTK